MKCKTCKICGREVHPELVDGWCDECVKAYDLAALGWRVDVAEWAAARARRYAKKARPK
jgi:hypothetical protein